MASDRNLAARGPEFRPRPRTGVGQNELGCGSETNSSKFRQGPVHDRSRAADLVTLAARRRLDEAGEERDGGGAVMKEEERARGGRGGILSVWFFVARTSLFPPAPSLRCGTTVPCTPPPCSPLAPVSPCNSARHGSLFRECNVM